MAPRDFERSIIFQPVGILLLNVSQANLPQLPLIGLATFFISRAPIKGAYFKRAPLKALSPNAPIKGAIPSAPPEVSQRAKESAYKSEFEMKVFYRCCCNNDCWCSRSCFCNKHRRFQWGNTTIIFKPSDANGQTPDFERKYTFQTN